MKTVHVQELSAEKFGLYGTFADMLHAAGPHIGTNPIEFYRDMTTVIPRALPLDFLSRRSTAGRL